MALLCHLGTSAITLPCGFNLVFQLLDLFFFLEGEGNPMYFACSVGSSHFVCPFQIHTDKKPVSHPWHPLVPPSGSCDGQAELSTQAIIKLGFMALPPATHSLHSFPMRPPGSPGG